MLLSELTDREIQAIKEVMIAVLVCPEIDSYDFDIRIGMDFEQIKRALRDWPPDRLSPDEPAFRAVAACLGEVCYSYTFDYDQEVEVGLPPEDWYQWFSLSKAELRALKDRWN